MSIWLLIGIIAYFLGGVIQWLQLRNKFQELDEYSNFPIVSVLKIITISGCLIEALTWPCSLILNDDY